MAQKDTYSQLMWRIKWDRQIKRYLNGKRKRCKSKVILYLVLIKILWLKKVSVLPCLLLHSHSTLPTSYLCVTRNLVINSHFNLAFLSVFYFNVRTL